MFTLLYNDHPLYKMCIERSKLVAPNLKVVTERTMTDGSRTYAEDTDIERVFYLAAHPDEIYLDADAILLKPFDFDLEPDYLYIGYNDYASNIADAWCVIGNNATEVLNYLTNYYNERNGDVPSMWMHNLLQTTLREKVRPIHDGYVRHLALHTTAVWCMENPGKSNSGLGYSAVYKNGQWDLTIGQ